MVPVWFAGLFMCSTIIFFIWSTYWGERALRGERRLRRIEDALNERDLFINPHVMLQVADELDCCPDCVNAHAWYQTGCRRTSTAGMAPYCPNDLAETLRALAKIAAA